MSKFSIASLMAKINTDALKARFKSVRKNRARLIPLVAIAALALIGLWFVNDLLDGALFTALLFVLFIVAFSALIFTCAPEESVKFIEQVIEELKAHWAKLKRSFKRLRELLKKSPEVVVDEEAEKVASAPSPVTPPVTTPRPAKTTRESSTAVPPAVPTPVKSSATVAGGPDALGKVAAATRRRGRAGRVLSMPDDGSDKS
jgi:predicted PurR-regulated permease PerM